MGALSSNNHMVSHVASIVFSSVCSHADRHPIGRLGVLLIESSSPIPPQKQIKGYELDGHKFGQAKWTTGLTA